MKPPTLQEDWAVIVSYMHHNGDREGELTADQDSAVRWLADGFGDLHQMQGSVSRAEIRQMHGDWSHVRDSSRAAILAMSAYLRSLPRVH